MGLTFAILCASVFICHEIAWADILFWKTGYIGKICAIPETIFLWPLTLIPVKPGSSIDGPGFWIPVVLLLLIGWSLLICLLIQKMKDKRKTEPAH